MAERAEEVADLAQARALRTIQTGADAVTTVEWSPVDDRIALGRDSGEVLLLDASGQDEIQTLSQHTERVHDLAFDASGELLASAGDEGYDPCCRLQLVHDREDRYG